MLAAALLAIARPVYAFEEPAHNKAFNRIASFPIYLNSHIDQQSVAEIVDVSKDGNTLVYTDGVAGKLGFVDIVNPSRPQALGLIDVEGEPTSVAVADKYALVVVNTSSDFNDPSGKMLVVDIKKDVRSPLSIWADSRMRSPSVPINAMPPSSSKMNATRM
nr:hypothetical protein [Methylomarinum sp. Ch1-1]MDP4520572.1 hypothetical protein [Methylomarinum sp. Ch1-1]